MQTKEDRLHEVAERRKNSPLVGYTCIGDYHDGKYECNFVSPYTISANNVDAELMIFLQDWASDKILRGPLLPARYELGHDPTRTTNVRLKELLRNHFQFMLKDIYATNVFPFVKGGAMNASIPRRDLIRAAKEFAIPQIEVVEPRFVVCLGKAAFNAVAVAGGQLPAKSLADAIANPFMFGKTKVWCQAHTGQQGTNNRNKGGIGRVSKDWEAMATEFKVGIVTQA
jgi:restriction system protein